MKVLYILLGIVIIKISLSKILNIKENIEDSTEDTIEDNIESVDIFDNSYNCMNSIITTLDEPTNDLLNSFKSIDYDSNIDEINNTNKPNYILLDNYNESIISNRLNS